MLFIAEPILKLVDAAGVEPAVPGGGGFTVHWGYQFSYTSMEAGMRLELILTRICNPPRSLSATQPLTIPKHTTHFLRRSAVCFGMVLRTRIELA